MIPVLPAKQPNEKWFIPFDFSNPLNARANPDATEDVGAIQVVTVENAATGEDVSEIMTDELVCRVYGQVAYVYILGGEDRTRYKITCRVVTDQSQQVFEMEAFLDVRET
jgi:hypothetical protein